MNDNYKPYKVDRVIGAPDNLKYHFITNPDLKDNPFETSMKNGNVINKNNNINRNIFIFKLTLSR